MIRATHNGSALPRPVLRNSLGQSSLDNPDKRVNKLVIPKADEHLATLTKLIPSQSDKKLSQSIRKDDKLNKEPNGSDFIDKSPSRAIITSTAATAILQKLEKL